MMRLVATVPLLKHWEQSAKLRGGVGGSHTDLHTGQGGHGWKLPCIRKPEISPIEKNLFQDQELKISTEKMLTFH